MTNGNVGGSLWRAGQAFSLPHQTEAGTRFVIAHFAFVIPLSFVGHSSFDIAAGDAVENPDSDDIIPLVLAPPEPVVAPAPEPQLSAGGAVRKLTHVGVVFLCLFLFVRTFALEPFGVPTGSMAAT